MRKLEYQQGLLDEPAELEESDFLESIARTIFRKGGGLLGELLNPAETGLDEGYLDDQGRLVVTEPLVRERNFRNWFGDSKVVDEEGRPLVMYHGSPSKKIKSFKNPRSIGDAYWFAYDPELAQEFTGNNGKIQEVYLKADQILDMKKNPETIKEFESWMQENKTPNAWNIIRYIQAVGLPNFGFAPVYDFAREKGYDGVRLQERTEGSEGWDAESIGVFEPTQIKSIHNRGTYNPDDPDLLGMNTMNMSLLYG